MLPRGTFVLLFAGLAIMAGSIGLGLMLAESGQPPPLWIRLPSLVAMSFGVILFVMGLYSVAVGLADAIRKRGGDREGR